MPEADGAVRALAEDLDLITRAARQGGEIAMRYFRRDPKVSWKPAASRTDESSPVTEADIAVDTFLRESLMKARPDHGWLSEETADTPERLATHRTFVVDPIDGTRAFIDGRTAWCISIAVVENGRALAGVLDCPAKEEIYAATLGGGATLNGERIMVARPGEQLHLAGPKAMIDAMPEALSARIKRHAYIPSLAYRLAMIARGAIDGTFVKANSHDWDLAAADLIVNEAGGRVLDARGKPPRYAGSNPRHGSLVAGSGALLDAMAQVIAGSAD